MKKNIRGSVVKDTLLEYNNLADTLKENTSNAVKSLLEEAVRDTYAQLLAEADENEYDEEEVEDTVEKDKDEKESSKENKSSKKVEDEAIDDDVESGVSAEEEAPVEGEEGMDAPQGGAEMTEDPTAMADDAQVEAPAEDGMEDLQQYRVGDNEYNLENADDETVVKVYKLLKDTDQVFVNVDSDANTVDLKDNETGAEYHIVLDNDADYAEGEEGFEDLGNENEEENFENMTNESIIFEVALNEYDSHVGYTDNYQKKDVMTNPGTSEPSKNTNDWDAGVPKGGSKPWAKPNKKAAPFNGGEGKKVEECGVIADGDENDLEEATNVGGFVQQNSTSKSHVPTSNGRSARNASQGGRKVKGTPNPRYSSTEMQEARIMNKVNKILKENNELKKALGKFKSTLEEAAVTNLNLGQIIKLISENTTSRDEKKEIIARFGKEATTVADSKKLYESISRELKKNAKMNISEDKQFTATGSQMINETQIYQSEDLVKSLDLMHRMMNK